MTHAIANRFRVSWSPLDRCPCGRGDAYANCCAHTDALPLLKVPNLVPPGPTTNFSNTGCYMHSTANCSENLSREHYFSETVMEQLHSEFINLEGAPWLAEGEKKTYGIKALTAKILCERHNNAFSPLDEIGGHAMRQITDAVNYATRKSHSERTQHFIISGEGFEQWTVKVLAGIYYGRIASNGRQPLKDDHSIDEREIVTALSGGALTSPRGLNIHPEIDVQAEHGFQFAPLSWPSTKLVSGVRIGTWGMFFQTMVDVRGGNPQYFAEGQLYRPWIIDINGPKRTARLVLTWRNNRTNLKGVQFTISVTEGKPSHT